MSRYERYGTRSLVYSKWHRYFLADDEPMIDLDAVEYCRRCNVPLVLIETARDVGQANKPTTVLAQLAQQSSILAICVLFSVDPSVGEDGCDCQPGRVGADCSHGVTGFRVRRVWPKPDNWAWSVMTPEEFRDRLRRIRRDHLAAVHETFSPEMESA